MTPLLVVAGGGHAGWRAAQAARAADPALRIVIAGEEPHLPYERPPLSKDALLDPQAAGAALATAQSCEQLGIEVRPGAAVTKVRRDACSVELADGSVLAYDRLVLATGSRPRRLPAAVDPQGIAMYLRTREDAAAIAARLGAARSIAVLGAGFIGLEVAAVARQRGLEVTVIERDARVAGRALPPACAQRLEDLHRANGVRFLFGAQLAAILPAAGGAASLDTDRGRIEADVVVAGIGVLPNVELAAAAGLAVDNGILVDAAGQTSDARIWAAGEVTRHPVRGESAGLRLESWQVAEQQARCAGASAAGARSEHAAWPWFWSDQYGLNLQCLGSTPAAADVVVRKGARGEETHFFLGAGRVLRGAIAFNAARDIGAARRLMDQGVPLDAAALADPAAVWQRWAA
ncbi:FAD-dependent oxidoreductase [Ramlibacter sp. G-1-2-2]|uniref:FAD-dependent oxidoreductase n=1 Tax=Ramlibacter agri TaxID=2728837 RepID=A0A848HEU2_9BURK|nr:FAD-dependent oxidoreductase [Ramlibacter agri]NML47861.1 FAD-dependent oxidoreductase [Ramlibacter agri]